MRRARISTTGSAPEQPAALFENPVGSRVKLFHGLIHRKLAVYRALGDNPHLVGDALPLRHFRRRLDAFQLVTKGARIDIVRDGPVGPGGASRREVAGELVKASLDGRLRKVLDQLPCGRLVTRSAEYRQARTAGDRRARAIRSRQRSSHPGILLFRRQAAFEFTDVPGAGYVERKISPTEFVPHVGDLGIGQWRRPATLEHPEVELKRLPEAAAFEITPAAILAQERLVLL